MSDLQINSDERKIGESISLQKSLIGHRPDILDCIANLSNDEVFTPPILANKILDLLPVEIWSRSDLKILDISSKSGVFLRECAKRLIAGLEAQIPNLEDRLNHIYENMLYGIAITELTAQISRRTLYCATDATSPQSVIKHSKKTGNILYENIPHSFVNGHCKFCGADESKYGIEDERENHAYQSIHEIMNIEEISGMKFDVIITNPPYQISDGGHGASARPIYHHFVNEAIKLNPKYITMIIPARWFAGGKGLDDFRRQMINDVRLARIVDYADAAECFPGVQIKGGVCYFLWDKDKSTQGCVIESNVNKKIDIANRPLNEFDVFIRFNKAISILKKVQLLKEPTLEVQISSQKPFGFRTNYKSYSKSEFAGAVKIYARADVGWVKREDVVTNSQWIDLYKVLTPGAGPGNDGYPHQITGIPIVVDKNTCCTETYLVAGTYKKKAEAESMAAYMKTKFFRFLVSLRKSAQHVSKDKFVFVPNVPLDRNWTDAELFQRYSLTIAEIEFIESMVKAI